MLKLAIVLIMLPFALFMVITVLLSVVWYLVYPLLIVGFIVWLWRRFTRR